MPVSQAGSGFPPLRLCTKRDVRIRRTHHTPALQRGQAYPPKPMYLLSLICTLAANFATCSKERNITIFFRRIARSYADSPASVAEHHGKQSKSK